MCAVIRQSCTASFPLEIHSTSILSKLTPTHVSCACYLNVSKRSLGPLHCWPGVEPAGSLVAIVTQHLRYLKVGIPWHSSNFGSSRLLQATILAGSGLSKAVTAVNAVTSRTSPLMS